MWDSHFSANNLACLNRILATRAVLGIVGFPHGGEGNTLTGRGGHSLWSKIQCKLEAISETGLISLQRDCNVCFD